MANGFCFFRLKSLENLQPMGILSNSKALLNTIWRQAVAAPFWVSGCLIMANKGSLKTKSLGVLPSSFYCWID